MRWTQHTTNMPPTDLSQQDTLSRIWQAHGLGSITAIQPLPRGMNNRATIVNDAFVIRFDLLDLPGVCRYVGEQIAYERTRAAGIPGPEVVTLDLTRSLIPYHYIILTRTEGTPLIDDWQTLNTTQQIDLGREAGHYLALMHEIEFEGFGKLGRLDSTPWPCWYDHVDDFFERFASVLVQQQALDEATYTRLRTQIDRLRPLLDLPGSRGRLVHSDYQFENVLHKDGRITAVLDYEWSIAGDPAWDFRIDEWWDYDCPGIGRYMMEGYAAVRALTDDHQLRVWLYKMLLHLDSMDMYSQPDQREKLLVYQREMMAALAALESEVYG